MLDDLLTPPDLARKLGVAKQTLAVWRLKGTGPAFYRAGSRILYRAADVESWLTARRRVNTCAPASPTPTE